MRKSCFLLFLVLLACGKPHPEKEQDTLFRLMSSEETGLAFTNELTEDGWQNIIEYLYFYNGSGVAAGDINNDGLVDIYLQANQGNGKLFLNKGNLRFEEITQQSGISYPGGWTTGVAFADVNGDGLLDLYVCRVGNYKAWKGHNLLFINNGNLTFTEASTAAGLNFSGFSTQSTFLDYDRDGDLDMFLLNHAVHTVRSYGTASKRIYFDSLAGDRFYENKLNQGQFSFEEVSTSVGIYSGAQGYGLGVVATDINQDGYQDIYVCNDFHEDDYLYLNTGQGGFVESGADWLNHTSRFSMGVDVADINGDGLFDIFSLDMLPENREIVMKSAGEDANKVMEIKRDFGYRPQYSRNAFQLNQSNHRFSEVAFLTGTQATDWSWSVLLQDYDNDGNRDIFITNGIFRRPNDLDYINFLSNINLNQFAGRQQDSLEQILINHMPALKIPNFAFSNSGGLTFVNRSSPWGLDDPTYSNGAAYADLDNDGDLDMVVNNLNHPAHLYENRTDSLLANNHYLQVSLRENSANRFALGAKVSVWAQNTQWVNEITQTRGFLSSVPPLAHFGLGKTDKIDSVVVEWPDGTWQRIEKTAINSHLKIEKEKTAAGKKHPALPSQNPGQKLPFRHAEGGYKDYDREALIPEKLSAEGPPLLVDDFTGDSRPDIYIGGAGGQAGALFEVRHSEFVRVTNPAFEEDHAFEDVDAEALDFENDGDLDMYVVTGGNEHTDGNPLLADRLYLNDGSGHFTRLETPLPDTNGGAVAVGDFDGDGYVDVFVGGRSVPGAYGLLPYSYILKNNKGKSMKVVRQWPAGMITDADWHDLDDDGDLDLIYCGDWLPISVLQNGGNGRWEEKTKEMGLGKTHGLWNVLKIEDLNADGKADILAGNQGTNGRLHADTLHPIYLYLDDFDKNGQTDPIIFYSLQGSYLPMFSRDDLVKQMPHLKKRFPSYEPFTQANSIESLMGKTPSSRMVEHRLYELRSCAFLSFGGGFRMEPLTGRAQFSTIEDFEFADLDSDGDSDIVYVGNFFGSVNGIGRYDANAGGVILNEAGTLILVNQDLPISYTEEYRGVRRVSDKSFVVVPNNGSPGLIQIVLKKAATNNSK